MPNISLDGTGLTPELISKLLDAGNVAISATGHAKMRAASELIDSAIRHKKPVYGVTTGLGSNLDKVLSSAELSSFSVQTLRGRAQALGVPLDNRIVRAAMIVRINTLLIGATGASIACVDYLRDCINANVTPVVGESASIGASDLVWGATMGLALIGEGDMIDADGNTDCATKVLQRVGMAPLKLGPRDGLALASHGCFSAALGALGVADSAILLANVQAAAALSMQCIGANTSPLREQVLAMCQRLGEEQAAQLIRQLLTGASIENEQGARRLQDPLSIRNIVQVHGAVYSTLTFARNIVEADINGSSDNPVVLVDQNDIVSSGAYHTTQLTIAIETLSRVLVHLATAQLARIGKLVASRFTGLPQYLAAEGNDSNGFAPLIKPAEALLAEIIHLANPVPIWPSICSDGVEDLMTNTPLAGKALLAIIAKLRRLTAIELTIAAQAIELRGDTCLGQNLQFLMNQVRGIVQPLKADRPMFSEIEALAEQLKQPLFDINENFTLLQR
jgi:histidine ammonia-lyase